MRIALLADVHANLPALEAVLADLESRGVDAAYHLGDLVGYAPWPDEVVALLGDHAITGVSGNYDSTVALDHAHCGCRYENPEQERLSHASFEWTKARISGETRRRLAALPFRLDVMVAGGHAGGARLILVHGTPTLNTVYWTADRSDSFSLKMAAAAGASRGDVIAFGHTHVPWTREIDGITFVNAGSVGRPKDADPRAGYVILDCGADTTVEFVRVAYDIRRAAEAIAAEGLPVELAAFLEAGGSPPVRSVLSLPHAAG